MSRLSPCARAALLRIGVRSRPAKSAEPWRAPLQHFGIAGVDIASRDIVREAIQFFGDATQNLLDVLLDGYICQSSRVVGLRMVKI